MRSSPRNGGGMSHDFRVWVLVGSDPLFEPSDNSVKRHVMLDKRQNHVFHINVELLFIIIAKAIAASRQ